MVYEYHIHKNKMTTYLDMATIKQLVGIVQLYNCTTLISTSAMCENLKYEKLM